MKKTVLITALLAGLALGVVLLPQKAQHILPHELSKGILRLIPFQLLSPFSGNRVVNDALMKEIVDRAQTVEFPALDGIAKSSSLRGRRNSSKKADVVQRTADSNPRSLIAADKVNVQDEKVADEGTTDVDRKSPASTQTRPSWNSIAGATAISLSSAQSSPRVPVARTMLNESGVQLEIPAEVTTAGITVRAMADAPPNSEEFIGIGSPIELGPEGALFRVPVKITLPYSPEELQAAGIGESSELLVMYFNPGTNTWSQEGIHLIGVDTAKNQVIAEVSHFSIFRIFAKKKRPTTPNRQPAFKFRNLLDYLDAALTTQPNAMPTLLSQTIRPNAVPPGPALLEGNALALLALAGPLFKDHRAAVTRLADTFVYLQSKDPAKDGRLRNAYDPVDQSILDKNSAPGNLALALLALIQTAKVTEDGRYRHAAESLGSFLMRFADVKGRGYFAVLWDEATVQDRPAKKTVDNLLLYTGFLRLYEITLDRKWWDAAMSATEFVENQWRDEYFNAGDAGLADDPVPWQQIAEDPNTWAALILEDKTRARSTVNWCQRNMQVSAQAGLGLDSNRDRDGISSDATLRYALTSLILEQDPQAYLAQMRTSESRLDPDKDLFPLDSPAKGITLDINKFSRAEEDLSAAVWLFAVLNRWNILWGQPSGQKIPTPKDIAPYVRIEEPQQNQVFRVPVIRIRGKAYPKDLSVAINGFGTRRDADDFLLDRFVLTGKGRNAVTAAAKAKDGREVSHQVLVLFESPPPTEAKIQIAEGSLTNKAMVQLILTAQGATEMRIEEDLKKGIWEPYQGTKTYLLSRGEGLKTIFAQYRNEFLEESPAVSASIILDTQPPSNASFQIEEGDYTIVPKIHLLLDAPDAAFFQVSYDGQTTPWLAMQSRFPFDLNPGDGDKVVVVRFRDQAGNETASVSRLIHLFVEKPTQLPKVKWIATIPSPPLQGNDLEIRALIGNQKLSKMPVKKAVCILSSDTGDSLELPMHARDGKFDSPEEEVTVTVSAGVLANSAYVKASVKGSDVFDRWGDLSTVILNPTPVQVLERVQQNYARIEDIKARLETTVQFPGGAQQASTRQFLLKRPDKMKTVSADGQEITILRGSTLTVKSQDAQTGSIDVGGDSGIPFPATNWVFNLEEFLRYHDVHFAKDPSGAQASGTNFYTLEAIPKDPSKANYSSMLFIVDYAKGIEAEVSYTLGGKTLSRLVHQKVEWVGDVAWFSSSDLKGIPVEDFGEVQTTENFKDIQINTGIPDSQFEL